MSMMNNRQGGFTLIELLFAVVIGMLVASAAYSVFFSTTRSARKSEQVTELQQNLRVAMEFITRDIRQAGFGLPSDGSALTFNDFGTTVSFSNPISVTNSNSGPDQITLLGVGHKIGVTYNSTGKTININPDLNGDDQIAGYMEERYAAASTDESGNLDSDYVAKFIDSGSMISWRRHLSIGGVEYLEADDYTNNTKYITVDNDASNSYANNIPVYFLQAIQYSIRTDCLGTEPVFPCLVSKDFSKLRGANNQVVAEAIEDIQFAYGVDVSPRDGKIDYPPSGYNSSAFESDPVDESSIVAVRISIVARSKVPDNAQSSNRPALEDRPAGATDNYIRRTLTKTIKLRNPRNGA